MLLLKVGSALKAKYACLTGKHFVNNCHVYQHSLITGGNRDECI